ncbi:MAG TPA: bifunctional proline dehydrogenase/L-glutamate gamma-semialdehyde dehydrogenase PutA, partial [Xanthomonadales bacterium]|nr:bifunctional proline dehydrogenase/L-glutamate gamma-semialdehyde dehydrogenase PutA [Xanthomonadales bacterium]
MNQQSEFDFVIASLPVGSPARQAINELYLADEEALVMALLEEAELDAAASERVRQTAESLVTRVRERKQEQGVLEAFMQEYNLSSEEGVVLMCLAEALLRIPDDDTAERLIADKLSSADWESHLGKSSSIFVNASTWGLMLTGKLVRLGNGTQRNISRTLGRIVNRSGEPMVRTAIRQAMRIMGFQYVMGRNIEEALDRSEKKHNRIYRHSFDMLGEAAMTMPDAERYFEAYQRGIRAVGQRRHEGDIFSAPSISVKLSALHPRFEFSQSRRVVADLTPRLLRLATLARENDMALTVDAEEADRLLLTLDVFARVLRDPAMAGWDGLGIAVQTYQKMAGGVFDALAELAAETGHRIPVRLVKGAYWDSEIKHAQVEGYPAYPVFTRKANTDLSFIACTKRVLAHRQAFYPQFATHNAHTIAVITELAGDRLDYEFQRLHGMGEDLYGEVMSAKGFNHACRVYAPVGSHEDLLPYLVRRLLENGANASFVNRIVDEKLPVSQVIEDPLEKVRRTRPVAHPAIPLPIDLYREVRRNSRGVMLACESEMRRLAAAMQAHAGGRWSAGPILASGVTQGSEAEPVTNPARPAQPAGEVSNSTAEQVDQAIADALEFAPQWDATPVAQRAEALEAAADLFEEQLPELMVLCALEAGKTVHDSIAEVREAADFLRYYAQQSRLLFTGPESLPGPTGEQNSLTLHGRGVFACISPWNFPLAIFTGQVSAALASGNTVLAKPAEQTPLIASRAVQLLHQAGIPEAALQFLPGDGVKVGARLTADPRIAGVAFTGSIETARLINRALAAREAPLATLIAETGGQNVMIVDSSALP